MSRRSFSVFVLLCTLPGALAGVVSGGKIEAVPGKRYQLTKRHGPWMIMVASFSEPRPEQRAEGMTPLEAADQLVYELRRKGIPAYVFSQRDVFQRVPTKDRLGRQRNRVYTARNGAIGVLAGNYVDAENWVAQKTLAYVKDFRPEFLREVERQSGFLQKLANGGLYRRTPGRPGPLSGAFLTINPMLSPEEVSRRKHDPLLLKLNSGSEYSLLTNEGKYTLLVKSFQGKSMMAKADGSFRKKAAQFEVSDSLDAAAKNAWQMAKVLRSQWNIEAYTYHDRYQSVVTVGAFDSPRDPRIRKLAEMMGAKKRRDPQTGEMVLTAEVLAIPGRTPEAPPLKTWLLDPYPRLIEVPRLR